MYRHYDMRGISAKIRLIFIILIFPLVNISAIGYPPVRNFNRLNYGGGSQNWAVEQDNSGRIFIGNREGLLKFDGKRWEFFRLPNYTTVRSVSKDIHGNRLYVGGTGEFGYFEATKDNPSLHYISLIDKLPDGKRNFSEIWNIHLLEDGKRIFQGDFSLFIFQGDKADVIDTGEKISTSANINDTVYVALQSGEILRLDGRKFVPLARATPLKGKKIIGIVPYYDNKLLIATAHDGLFTWDGEGVKPLTDSIDNFLKENQIFSIVKDGDSYAIGTVNRGAVVKNFRTGETSFINKDTGLQDNTVLGMKFDMAGNLWLCLDNGIGYAILQTPVYNFLGVNSDAGAGYSSLKIGDRIYLATNRGLFSTNFPAVNNDTPPSLHRHLGGQIWSIDTIGGDIFFSADNGLYVKESNRNDIRKLDALPTGSWSVAQIPADNGEALALASTYSGFYLLKKIGNAWTVQNKIEGYDDAGGKFIPASDGFVWMAHWMKGIYRLKLSDDRKRFQEIKLFNHASGLPDDRDNSLFLYDGEIHVSTASGEIFSVTRNNGIEKDASFSSILPLHFPVHFFTLPGKRAVTFSPNSSWRLIPDGKGSFNIDSISLSLLTPSLIPGFEHVGQIDGENVLVSNQEGFVILNLEDMKRRKTKQSVFVESLVAGDSIIFSSLPPDVVPEIKLPFSRNSITFNFASPEYSAENSVLYSYRLENYDKEWSQPANIGYKEYTKLHEGKYTFRLRAYNRVTGETSEYSLDFTILPPWYRSTLAKIIYALLIILIIFLSYRWIRSYSLRTAIRIRRQKEAELENMRKEAEREALQKDYEIAALKSDRLEQDIKHKSSELSNITMNVIRKNEMLHNLTSKLNRLQGKIEDSEAGDKDLIKEVETLKELISANISHDDDWKRFNQNFDIVYADFTKKLSEQHPDLTVSELRLCCYLKMGLSSKEIAPLFNISSKSVEMNRYRLRKKMNLGRETNLTSYLQKIE